MTISFLNPSVSKMVRIDLSDLSPGFSEKVIAFANLCYENGLSILIYCGFRSPEEQATLYCQGRTMNQIVAKAESLRKDWNSPHFADILMAASSKPGAFSSGRVVTKAGPGQSMHNYGLAVDGAPMIGGKTIWDNKSPLWKKYGEFGVASGLEWAGNWTSFTEYPHLEEPGVSWKDLISDNRKV